MNLTTLELETFFYSMVYKLAFKVPTHINKRNDTK